MNIIKGTNGFPYAWKAGRVEHLIRGILERKAQEQLSVDRVMIINPTWLQDKGIDSMISDADPDFIICHNFVDPVIPQVHDAIVNSGRPHIIIGNTADYRIDFWAIVCDLYFKFYKQEDIEISPGAKSYICLNRKPHPHRRFLVEQLQQTGVFDQGWVTLGVPGEGAITVDNVFTEDQGILDEYGAIGVEETTVSSKIKNDIFSLGNLEIWRRSHLCVVTETDYMTPNLEDFFISEKTWKPIIGLRPFYIYGQPGLRRYLKAQGFDVFEDIFDYSQIDAVDPELYFLFRDKTAQAVIDAIKQVNSPYQEGQDLMQRCIANRLHFTTHVQNQWHRLQSLDLTKYV
jgi:hypothetical protein